MSDFAAAAMLRLVALGLRRQGLPAPPAATPPARGARVPLDHKRALLQGLLAAHGPTVLLRLGEGIADGPDEPVLTALAAARTLPELLARWGRLERYVHSHHRVRATPPAAAGGAWQLRHVSLRAGQPPQPAESLVVCGLLVALAAQIGVRGLRLGFDGEPGWRHADGRWRDGPLPASPGAWRLQADAVADEACTAATAAALAPDAGPAATTAAARAALAADPGAPWTLDGLARRLGLPPRTLQRRLGAAGSGFATLLRDVRVAASARLLVFGDEATALVGYRCGFADQAHFTRCFKAHTAITPALYRAQFGAMPAPQRA